MPGFSISSKDDVQVQAEHFDRPIQIEQLVSNPTGNRDDDKNWTLVVKTWAHMEPWKGFEHWQGQQVYPQFFMRFLIRFRPSLNITDAMRIRYGTRKFNIRSVQVALEARRVIEITAEELQAKGTLRNA